MYPDILLYTIPSDKHGMDEIKDILTNHPEIEFISFVGMDLGGRDTDEKIPTRYFIENMEKLLTDGVQTDGSSVILPKIAEINNARVDIIPDLSVHWYVDYNHEYLNPTTGLPVGTLRIPSDIIHNENFPVGSRQILAKSVETFETHLLNLLKEHPYVFEHIDIDSVEDIESIQLTAAVELEFWVKSPEHAADLEQLSTSQTLKEQYWKRTVGPVRTALESVLLLLDKYGFEIEMGHKEVGGVKAQLINSGGYDHIMEQLEIDWKYSNALQTADNECQIKYFIRDVFRLYGLEVTFSAKPIEGVAGSGKHTHMGVVAKLKNGKKVNVFTHKNVKEEFLSPIGYGALMGILKNYEVVNPFITASNESFNRLKPGFEAPICVVTSLGHEVETPSRNRTVLAALVRDTKNPRATRIELRSPHPKGNSYLTISASYMAMLEGIEAVLKSEKTPGELEKIISKSYGEEAFYLEKDRIYRSEENVFSRYSEEERDQLFGKAPNTVWENIEHLETCKDKLDAINIDHIFEDLIIESYKAAILSLWMAELSNRIIPENIESVVSYKKIHLENGGTKINELDRANWESIINLKQYLMKDNIGYKSLFSRIKEAINQEDYPLVSELQLEMQEKMTELTGLYVEYRKNIF